MGYTTTVRTKLKAPDFGDLVTEEVAARVQYEVVDLNIKASIRVGLSPVQGYGRFVPYKDKEKYPGERKPSAPVNLELSGELLENYEARATADKKGVTIGIHADAPAKVKARAEGNNTGSAKGVPVRRIVPIYGETFKVSTLTLLRIIFSERILEMLGKK